ncbi:MAG: cysteine--tRNA ligase [Candidatus Beckwithbacteria bacterium]
MKIYNSLNRKVEEFIPIKPGIVGVYTCGPTVYSYVTIGNWRTYVLGDLLVRTLKYFGMEVNYLMNITDVGHLTGDNLGNADLGDDRLEIAAKKEKKSAYDVAKFYTKDFLKGFDSLNLTWPKDKKFCKATEHIQEQIELVKKIEKKGLTYKTEDGIYFDVKAYEKAGHQYGQLSTLDQIKTGIRAVTSQEKKDQRDFALWKFSPSLRSGQACRQMEWESPWGKGFPGWHIECSAMSMKYLGEQFDIHIGGEDLKSTHHPNEICQSEAATGKKPFVKYWIHGAFLLVDNGRMGKSLGNAYTLADLEKKGYSAMNLRYFYLTGHYHKPLNFTFKALDSAKEAESRLRSMITSWQKNKNRTTLSEEKLNKVTNLVSRFKEAVENDLNLPQALAIVWEMAKSNIPNYDKLELISDWDQILGLNLLEPAANKEIPEEIKTLINQRDKLRKDRQWEEADKLRQEIESKGFKVQDRPL